MCYSLLFTEPMKQREITDSQTTKWTCVQALAGIEGKTAKKAENLLEGNGNKIPVVCTPSGGEQSVRLLLNAGWYEQLPDEKLIQAIEQARKEDTREF